MQLCLCARISRSKRAEHVFLARRNLWSLLGSRWTLAILCQICNQQNPKKKKELKTYFFCYFVKTCMCFNTPPPPPSHHELRFKCKHTKSISKKMACRGERGPWIWYLYFLDISGKSSKLLRLSELCLGIRMFGNWIFHSRADMIIRRVHARRKSSNAHEINWAKNTNPREKHKNGWYKNSF